MEIVKKGHKRVGNAMHNPRLAIPVNDVDVTFTAKGNELIENRRKYLRVCTGCLGMSADFSALYLTKTWSGVVGKCKTSTLDSPINVVVVLILSQEKQRCFHTKSTL